MHPRLSFTVLALAAAGLAVPAAAQQAAAEHHMPKPSRGFAQLTPLAGEWEGKSPDGKIIHASYQVVSGGNALLERLQTSGEPEMLTVYAPDGERVAVTHFCSAGNQPQMQTAPITGDTKQFSFDFVHASNLASPTTGHMHHLTLTLADRDHLTQEWTWQESGQSKTMAFQFTRKS
ncbi:MAG TPA: hypothetical protein VEO73_09385 [Gemmatimonadales bacterium]|jgi:hypothetical protein|nr:hypothetical protein [Gemmatimonadales bacterium]